MKLDASSMRTRKANPQKGVGCVAKVPQKMSIFTGKGEQRMQKLA